MRTSVRPRIAAGILVLLTALVAGLVLVGMPPTASAQPPATAARAAVTPTPTLVVVDSSMAEARIRTTVIARLTQHAKAAQAAHVTQLRQRIVQVAKKQVGDRYSAGSSGPHAFDCSGLTRFVYKTVLGKELPHHSRSQYAKVKKIPRSKARPGDLVFFFRNGAHHVGIYIGNGKMVDAAGYGKGVRVSPISGSWWSRTYSGMGRLLPA